MSKIYTPIATREILLLIRCKVEHRDEDFKETALRPGRSGRIYPRTDGNNPDVCTYVSFTLKGVINMITKKIYQMGAEKR